MRVTRVETRIIQMNCKGYIQKVKFGTDGWLTLDWKNFIAEIYHQD